MSTANGSGEPSMEEILASIRNIIADEPETATDAAAQAGLGIASAPNGPGVAPKAEPAGLSQRLAASSSAAQSGFGAAKPTLESTPPAASDAAEATDDFSDLFDEPISAPAFRSGDDANGRQEPVLPPLSAPPKVAPDLAPSLSAEAAPAAAPLSVAAKPVAPIEKADAPAGLPTGEAEKPKAAGFDFAAFRPSRETPETPAAPSNFGESASLSVGKPLGGSEEKQVPPASTNDAASSTPSEPKKRVVIASMAPPTAAPAAPAGVAPKAEQSSLEVTKAFDGAARDSGRDAQSDSGPSMPPVAETSAARAVGTGNVAAHGANVGFLAQSLNPIDKAIELPVTPSQPSSEAKVDADAALEDEIPTEVVLSSKPSAASDQVPEATEPKPSSFAAAMKDRGLQTEASEPKPEPKPKPAHEGREPVAESFDKDDTPDLASAPAKSPAAAPGEAAQNVSKGVSAADVVVSSMGGQVRTLEDTVAELLRPLLREWLENNMPRIVENALRLEVAESVKKQLDVTINKPDGIGHK